MVILTEAAVDKVAELLQREPDPSLKLRLAVQPGGCSGLRYDLHFSSTSHDGDDVSSCASLNGFEFDVAVDRMSAPYLDGATIDFVDTLSKQGFVIDNPNAAGGCACGDSFH